MVAWSIPRSLIICIRLGAVKAIPTSPYWPSSRIPATIITPSAEIMEDKATPQKRLNPPFVDVLASFTALLTAAFSGCSFFTIILGVLLNSCLNKELKIFRFWFWICNFGFSFGF